MLLGDIFNSNTPFKGGSGPKGHFVQMNGRCPVCQNAFDFRKLHVLSEQNGATLLHITCQNCQSSTLASVILGQSGLNFSGIVTDLNITDVLKFKDQQAISTEYIVDLHEELVSNNLRF